MSCLQVVRVVLHAQQAVALSLLLLREELPSPERWLGQNGLRMLYQKLPQLPVVVLSLLSQLSQLELACRQTAGLEW